MAILREFILNFVVIVIPMRIEMCRIGLYLVITLFITTVANAPQMAVDGAAAALLQPTR